MRTAVISLLIFLIIGKVYAAEYPEWEGFPSLVNIKKLAVYEEKIYGASPGGIVQYDPANNKYELFYKNHGLEANNVLSVAVAGEKLYFGFRDNGLMIFDTKKKTFSPVLFPEYVNKDDSQKTIAVNDIFALNDSILFIAHSKGVDMLNMNSEEIRTYNKLSRNFKEDTPVNRVYVFKNKIWACTGDGLAWADINNPNLEFPENWDSYSNFGAGVNCIENFISSSLDVFYIGTDGKGIYSFDYKNKNAVQLTDVEKLEVYDFNIINRYSFAATSDGLYINPYTSWTKKDFANYSPLSLLSISDSSDSLWIGTASNGIKCLMKNTYLDIPPINCPRSQTIRSIEISSDKNIWAATSIRDKGGFVLKFQNGLWSDYSTLDGIPGTSDKSRDYETTTNSVLSDSSGRLWFGTWGYGVFMIDDKGTIDKADDVITHIDPEMKVILPYQEGTNFVVNRSIDQDNKGNIWITGWSKGVFVIDGNFNVSQPITNYPNLTYTFEENVDYVWKVFADNEGWIWLGTYKNGLIIINPGQNVFSKNDDIIKRISMNEGLLGYYIESINQDKEGNIWVGSEGGLNRIEKLQNGSFKVDKMNSLLGVDTIEVNGIDIDHLNNKWIGTSSGVAKISADDELKAFYTRSNSGLISDYILSLKYDNDNDILWIGTDSGVEKFKAVSEQSTSKKQYHIYPNPFEIWGLNSKVNFTGLKAEKPVRIYSFNGDIVNEVTSTETDENGYGRAIWNGRNFKDEFVGSGIYFITGTDSSGKEFRDKMVIVRR